MKKRNQFLLAGIKFLASSICVYALGVNVGNKIENKILLDVDEAIVSQSHNESKIDANIVSKNNIISIENIYADKYTQGALALGPIEEAAMNAICMNIIFNKKMRMPDIKMPELINYWLDKPPRLKTIFPLNRGSTVYNTS